MHRLFKLLTTGLAVLFLVGAAGCKSGGEGLAESNEPASILDRTQPYLTNSNVNVRNGPGLQYPVVVTVKSGIRLNVLTQEGDWLKVVSRFGRPPGYIHASLAYPIEKMVSDGSWPKPGPYLTIRNTTVRQGPGFAFLEVARIPTDTRVNVVESDGEWVRVESKRGNPPGYVPKRDLDFSGVGR